MGKCILIYIGVAAIWISVAPVTLAVSGLAYEQTETDLIRTILNPNRYSIYAKPRRNPNDLVDVNVSLEIHKLRALDFTIQTMEWMGWLEVVWHDEFLQWDPIKYKNVKQIYLSIKNIWSPDLLPLNSVNHNFDVNQVLSSTQAAVHHTGRVVWMTTSMFITSCVVEVHLFPFDVQHCRVDFGSRTHTAVELRFRSPRQGASYNTMDQNGQWHVEGIPVEQGNVTYDCCEQSYSTLSFKFILRRKPMFFLYNLLLPGLLVLMVGLAAFMLPADSGDKVSLAITALLTMVVFMQVVMDNLPPNSDTVPLLSVFFGVATAMLALSTVMTVVVAVVSDHGTFGRCPPRRLGILLSGPIARYLFLPSANWTQSNNGFSNPMVPTLMQYKRQSSSNNNSTDGSKDGSRVASLLEEILKEIRDKRETNELGNRCVEQWMVVATFVDRIGFLVVLIGLLALVVGLFSQVK